jgi:hypothetical protein
MAARRLDFRSVEAVHEDAAFVAGAIELMTDAELIAAEELNS